MTTSITFDEFVTLVRQYTLTPTAIQLSKLSYDFDKKQISVAEMEFDDPGMLKRKTYVAQHMLAFISYQAILRSNDYRGKVPSHNDILLLCNRYGCLVTETEADNTPLGMLVRISQEQLPFQEIGYYHFARGYYLLKEISKRDGYSAPVDLERIFQEWCGLNIDEFYLIAWCLNCAGREDDPTFSKSWFLAHEISDLKGVLTEENLDKFLLKNSTSIKQLRDENDLPPKKWTQRRVGIRIIPTQKEVSNGGRKREKEAV